MNDDINELIESDYPNTFNLIQKVSNNAYQAVNTEHQIGGWAVRAFEKIIWIMHPPFSSVTDAEMKANFVLSSLYADYFDDLGDIYKKLLCKHNFNFSHKYIMSICPSSTKYNDELSFLSPYFLRLSKEKPLLVVTYRIDHSKISSCIVYDSHYLIDLFSHNSNIGEQYCIKQFLESLIEFSDNISADDAEKIANAFVEKNIPNGNKAYTIERINVSNPKLNDYSNYQEPSQTQISRVISEIAVFLDNNGVKPGEYEGNDVKRLNDSIFDFLYQRLEDEINRYDDSLLFYTYRQVELIEGKREINGWQSGVDASKRTDYDFVGKNVKEIKKIASVASSTKLIVEIFLKVGSTSSNKIDSDSWSYLQALSIVLHETIVICEYIEYDIVHYKLIINDAYEIQDVKGDELFDHEDFYRCKSEITSSVSMESLLYQKNSRKKELEIESDYLAELENINKAFIKQYNFSCRNFINTLRILGRMDMFDDSHFPLSIITEEVIVSKLLQHFGDNSNVTELENILRFISLDLNSYKHDIKLVPTNLLRRKDRLNLCPLIYLKSGKYLYGNQMCLASSNLWRNSIIYGHFPCTIDQKSKINEALKSIHFYLDKELEKDAGEIAKTTLGDKNVEINILNFKRLSYSIPNRPPCGEIDLLAANEDKKILFVIDAKNMNLKNRPYDVRHEVDKFLYDKKSYLVKLSRKESFIGENIEEVLKHFEIQDFEKWAVKKAFVVNKIYPSAFSNGGVDFILLRDLSSYLTQ